MKELLKKASLTVATACLVAGGLVSVGWADSDGSSSQRVVMGPLHLSTSANSAEKIEKQEPMPDELEINGQRYKKARLTEGLVCQLDPSLCQ